MLTADFLPAPPARPAWAARSVFIALALQGAVQAQDFARFDSRGLPRSQGVVVRVDHPAGWKRVAADDELALAELRGPHGSLTGILQIARGRPQKNMAALCRPDRARTMLQGVAGREPGTRITDVVAHTHQDRPAFDVRYERHNPPDHVLVRSRIICLKDTRLVVSCAGVGARKQALAPIEPLCQRVLDSVTVAEDSRP